MERSARSQPTIKSPPPSDGLTIAHLDRSLRPQAAVPHFLEYMCIRTNEFAEIGELRKKYPVLQLDCVFYKLIIKICILCKSLFFRFSSTIRKNIRVFLIFSKSITSCQIELFLHVSKCNLLNAICCQKTH